MNNCIVTVGIPFYNPGANFELAILSVLQQTFKELNLILLDDGSDDGISLLLANRYKFVDNRVSVLSDGENRGLVARLNELSNIVKTKYYARMDADDIMHPERIQKQIDILESNISLNACASEAIIINENNELTGKLSSFWPTKRTDFLLKNSLIHPSILFSTSWISSKSYDPQWTRMEDLELWFRTFDELNLEVLKEPLLYYRVDSNSKSKYVKTEQYKRKFFFAIYKKKEITFFFCLYLTLLSLIKQLISPVVSSSSQLRETVDWKNELDYLYFLNKFQNSRFV